MKDIDKSSHTFIAYKGRDVSKSQIESALYKKCSTYHSVTTISIDDSIFAKEAYYDDFIYTQDPYWNEDSGILTVNGYNQDEIERTIRDFSGYEIKDPNTYPYIINYMFRDYRNNMFKELGKYMHFCSVVWEKSSNSIIAGVTKPNSEYTRLYYGYTEGNHELMFSNDQTVLEQFCIEITEMPANTYMKNGELYTLDGKKLKEEENTQTMIQEAIERVNSSIDGLNALLMKEVDEKLKAKIIQNIENYLFSDDPKKRIDDFISRELDNETKKQILTMIVLS